MDRMWFASIKLRVLAGLMLYAAVGFWGPNSEASTRRSNVHINKIQRKSQALWSYVAKSGADCRPNKVSLLVKQGADVNYEKLSSSVLNEASAIGASACAIKLLDLGATSGVKKPDSMGFYAINGAAQSQHCSPQLIRRLVDAGASVNSQPGFGPLSVAALEKNIACVKVLIVLGAKINAFAGQHAATPLMLAQLPGRSPSHEAIKLRKALTKLFVRAGARINLTQRRGMTALFYSVGLEKPFNVCADCANILLKAGANPNVIDKAGDTPLLWALEPKHRTTLAAVRTLVKGGANVNLASPKTGETPLMAAAARGDGRIVRYLLRVGAQPCVHDKAGRMAANYAREHHYSKLVKLLSCHAH